MLFAILGNVSNTCRNGFARIADLDRLASHFNGAPYQTVNSKDRLRQLRTARAYQACHGDNFTRSQFKGNIANLGAATVLIERLQALGCTFALDDFGSGLSSFVYLKTLAVDYLKIDGAFVKNIVNDPIDYAMVKSINELGHATGKFTIAEFAATGEIIDKLRELGVDYAQGYAVERPAPPGSL